MKIFDITLPISPQMPVWPGDPAVQIERVSKIEKGDNANVSHLSLSVHTGTHVDAPFHFLSYGVVLDQVPLDLFVGSAYVAEFPDVDLITSKDFEGAGIPNDVERLLLKTRNSEKWASGVTQFQVDFTAISPDAAQYLVDQGIKLIGIDYLSIAPYKQSRPTHEILLEAGVAILEGVDLSEVPEGKYTLYCLPLKLEGVDGAPARAILVED